MKTFFIKPISLNSAYRGRRFRTPELDAFQLELIYILPQMKIPKGKLSVKYIFGVSSANSDADNLVKATQDALADRYHFNDKMIYHIEVTKYIVKKGDEFVGFEINPYLGE